MLIVHSLFSSINESPPFKILTKRFSSFEFSPFFVSQLPVAVRLGWKWRQLLRILRSDCQSHGVSFPFSQSFFSLISRCVDIGWFLNIPREWRWWVGGEWVGGTIWSIRVDTFHLTRWFSLCRTFWIASPMTPSPTTGPFDVPSLPSPPPSPLPLSSIYSHMTSIGSSPSKLDRETFLPYLE